MGVFDEVVTTDGETHQTKDGECLARVYHPGDPFPACGVVTWISFSGDSDQCGLVLDGVWTGIVGAPDEMTPISLLRAGEVLLLTMKARIQELQAEKGRAEQVVNALRYWRDQEFGAQPAWAGRFHAGPMMGDSETIPDAIQAVANVLAWYDGEEDGDE